MATDRAVLCYVDGPWAYFTTQLLADQWGDDWDDAPYEHNAGEPYSGPTRGETGAWNPDGSPRWKVVKVAWEGPYETPAQRAGMNSSYSVQAINRGAVAWLTPVDWEKDAQPIPAGVTFGEFSRLIRSAGGRIYV